jgi:hypothetical protein
MHGEHALVLNGGDEAGATQAFIKRFGISGIQKIMAEREGFEPPVRLPVLRISSATHSTTLPPLREGSRLTARWSRSQYHAPAGLFKLGAPVFVNCLTRASDAAGVG